MRGTLLITLLLLLPALAGCIGASEDDPTAPTNASLTPPRALSSVVAQAHDHAGTEEHTFSWNLDPVGFQSGYEDGEIAGGFTELAVHLPYVYLCRGGSEPGVVVVDVSEPETPRFVSHFAMPRCDDIETSQDGAWVFASAQRNRAQEAARDSDGPASLPRGTWVLDASDPRQLVFESFYPMPYNGPHTISTYRYEDGREVVFHMLYDLYARLEPTGQAPVPAPDGSVPVSQRIEVTELTQGPEGTTRLEQVAVYQDLEQATMRPEATIIPHDAIVHEHPETGTPYLLVAYWDAGVQVVDVSDPSDPVLVSEFQDFAPSALANIHQVRAFPNLLDGRWIVVAEPEIVTAEESGQLTFIDATDPTQLVKLGHWTLPGEVTIPEPFLFSPHNFDLDEAGRIYLAHQHAGLWVISVHGTGTPSEPAT
ncbi:MAG: hypothetical protein R3185_07045, partial [Candidatus Thermoplasmatota archaeon]|nr:hypothetical protein [Candidatus Thermoplasmatota archaeon]